ncbi:MAG: flagellin [Oceanicaulis sp.]|mgnify:FL=1|jgi:flagellin|uniref:flagellin n=1 Tax=unclassified Oceanicaulis TaxID=2632123 RepID=UPI000066D463|nr:MULTISPECIES: flagellin [unclassified Oceanicaulis]EAP91496.1 flagellin FljL [Oceanicaulis sp. HTCC2633]MAB69815.1 flagellin [Oceanicaulis sp.]MBC39851.1 flagellin [Oceanicaulis sp.]HCR94674.1 flagellin [Oceanicaulis sp.]|tara:strand:+ start:1425 stop:2258 length:834 start_codon:yes stop_codon:yes gene_type:complete
MALSVHTNTSAMIALQNLNKTNEDIQGVQNKINTGLRVAGAKDNSSVYAVAQGMRSDIGALGSVKSSLDRAVSIGDVAIAAGESISDLLIQMREKATAALDPSIDTFSRQAYDSDFKELLDQVQVILTNAEFDGANLLNGSLTNGIAFLADADATRSVTLEGQNLSISGAIITLANNASLGTVTLAGNVVSAIQTSLDNVNQALANLGSDLKKMEAHRTFVGKLTDSLTEGVGNLVDADLAKESARLQALQVKQQLGVQALSIANSEPQIILNLFGG